MLRQIEEGETLLAAEAGEAISKVTMVKRQDRQSDLSGYNLLASNEVAMVFCNQDGEPPFYRDIRIYSKPPSLSQKFLNLSILSSYMDPMTYAFTLSLWGGRMERGQGRI